MADVLIRGMAMPEFCDECGCKRRTQRGACCGILGKPLKTSRNYKRDDDCPLLPLPENHGRLGDLNAMYRQLHNLYHGAISDSELYVYEVLDMISNAPTIVPAEGGNAHGNP